MSSGAAMASRARALSRAAASLGLSRAFGRAELLAKSRVRCNVSASINVVYQRSHNNADGPLQLVRGARENANLAAGKTLENIQPGQSCALFAPIRKQRSFVCAASRLLDSRSSAAAKTAR